MSDFAFAVESIEPVPFAAVPQLVFRLRITNVVPGRTIHSAMLQCRLEIEPSRRHYDAIEKARLFDLFDRPERWGRTLRRFPWTEASIVVPPFSDSVVVDLRVVCSRDLESSATRFFFALDEGVIPLVLSFRGTAFHDSGDGNLQVVLIASDEGLSASLPVSLWQSVREQSDLDHGWLRVRKDTFDRLSRHKTAHGFSSWQQTLDALLARAEEICHADITH